MQTCSGPLVHWQGSPKISWHNLLYPLNSPSTKSQWLPWTLASLLTGVKKIVCLQLLAPNKEFVYYPRSTKPSLTRAYLNSQKLQFYLRAPTPHSILCGRRHIKGINYNIYCNMTVQAMQVYSHDMHNLQKTSDHNDLLKHFFTFPTVKWKVSNRAYY